MVRVIHEKKRGCGYRLEGGLYVVGEGSPNGVLPPWVSIEPPIPYDGQHFRGFVYVDGDRLLGRETQDLWLIGASLDGKLRQNWLTLLGMPPSIRQKIGDCKGAKSPDEVAKRLSKLGLYNRMRYKLATAGLLDEIKALGLFETESGAEAVDLAKRTEFLELTAPQILAACWRIARRILWNGEPTTHHIKIRKELARIMVLLGATKDALDLHSGRWLRIWRHPTK